MGPPISWHGHSLVNSDSRRSAIEQLVDSFRVTFVNYTFALVFFQIILNFQYVRAGPVVFNLEYSQGPVSLARNIRHLPCISRRTGQEGLCMFAIDCLKTNGTHLGTCIDRFYFGSCCQIPDKTILPQVIGNHIDDNSIDGANFVHPLTEDKIQNPVIPDSIFPFRKPTTEKIETTKTVELELETKSDETTIDKENDEKSTTVMTQEKSTEPPKDMVEVPVTEVPIKLSTFQTVSGESSSTFTEKTEMTTTKVAEPTSSSITTTTTTSSVTLRPKPTRKPTRPSTFTRPTYKPYNITRPQYTQSTFKPKPTKPALNTTRKPPYRLPSKRPSTKKPLPIPPRLNITILPQATSSKPLFTRPQFVSITYINTTQVSTEEPKEEITTTTTSTTSTTPSSTTTTEKATTSEKATTTEKVDDTTELLSTTFLTTEALTEKVEKITTELPEMIPTESIKTTEGVTEKETLRPLTEADIPETEVTTTEYPPFVTWSSNTDTVTKTPEKVTDAPTTTTQETWSPITPPEGWILLSTIAPKPETTTSKTETPTAETIETQETTLQLIETTERLTEASSLETIPTSTSTTTEKVATSPSTTSTTTEKVTTSPATTSTTTEKVTTSPATTSTTTEKVTTSPATTTTTTEKVTTSPTTEVNTSPVTTTTTTENINISPVTSSATTEKVNTSPLTTYTTTEKTNTAPLTTTEKVTSPTTTTVETTAKATEKAPETTQAPIAEFTVNVTLSPTIPTTTTSSITITLSTNNGTKDNGTTEATTSAAVETSTNASTTVETTTEAVNMSDYKNVCGRRLWQAPTGRIVGGAKSGFGMWPWQISLRQYRTSTYLHKCGAALLNENWAITAAHCVEHVPPSELLVRLGEHDLANEDEPYGFAERRVQIVASHPHFDPATFEYDLALLRFYEPVKFQPNILPVCVPDDDDDYVGKSAYVTGWGRLYDEGPLPSVLQEVQVPVINNTACEAMYQAAGYNEHIPNIFICAGRSKGGTDSCEGDSGGPMVLPRERDGRFVLGGVISWGIGCAEPNQPGVYTRISEFRDWINQILQF